jgi:hypothetical protein
VLPKFSKPQNAGFVNLTTTPGTTALRTRRLQPFPKIRKGILLVWHVLKSAANSSLLRGSARYSQTPAKPENVWGERDEDFFIIGSNSIKYFITIPVVNLSKIT